MEKKIIISIFQAYISLLFCSNFISSKYIPYSFTKNYKSLHHRVQSLTKSSISDPIELFPSEVSSSIVLIDCLLSWELIILVRVRDLADSTLEGVLFCCRKYLLQAILVARMLFCCFCFQHFFKQRLGTAWFIIGKCASGVA